LRRSALRAVPAHQLDLQVVRRIEIRKAVLDRARQARVRRQPMRLAGDQRQRVVGALPRGLDRREYALAQPLVLHQPDVARGDAEGGPGEHPVEVRGQGTIERPRLVHALQQREVSPRSPLVFVTFDRTHPGGPLLISTYLGVDAGYDWGRGGRDTSFGAALGGARPLA
jgi:hypothetical protein